ncbi:MAG: hypothetical protein ACYTGZ_02470 [Planctomycetota bacterium]|jgi:hypothetical protein
MIRLIPLSILVLAFWLGNVRADSETQPTEIVLVDGDWKTTIRAGRIDLAGPNGAGAGIYLGQTVTIDGKPVRRTAPLVSVVGPRPATGRTQASVAIWTDGEESTITIRGVSEKDSSPRDGNRLVISAPFVGIGASVGETSIRFLEGRKTKLVLPDKTQEEEEEE